MRTVLLAALALTLTLSERSVASDVIVAVTADGVAPDSEVACKLFAGPAGFPDAGDGAMRLRAHWSGAGDVCRFRNLKPGTYAVSVALLPPGQEKLSFSMFGRPRQPWGVSNNARPAFRAPSFTDAAFSVVEQRDTRITIRLAK